VIYQAKIECRHDSQDAAEGSRYPDAVETLGKFVACVRVNWNWPAQFSATPPRAVQFVTGCDRSVVARHAEQCPGGVGKAKLK